MNFTDAEVCGLAAAVSAHRGQPFDGHARAALTKVLGVMEPRARRRATELTQRVWIDRTDADVGTARSRHAVDQALQERRVLWLSYRDREGTGTDGTVDPVLLARARGHWFLVARCRHEDAVRWFRIGRVERARVTAECAADIPVESVGTPPPTAEGVNGRCGRQRAERDRRAPISRDRRRASPWP
ncbi:helix-turn-helix transcriptional regulator [Nocardiopsis metallicus]|uniref:Putative DNA-binding transcriptional regulator YafY n=1 Tax=Nocardiopsis metallicus TaxID=179819 RepID=A0A840WC66_9ACTN|nr:WYL domain-containing protein [Nocardiopsis metallicus]MBB5493734.1 putative DNA-binding transcriptional regulator YafY [Nocardiopsis metallicus]